MLELVKTFLTIYKVILLVICDGVQFSIACSFVRNVGWDDIDCHEGLITTTVTSIFMYFSTLITGYR
jgi:hypothetical protein